MLGVILALTLSGMGQAIALAALIFSGPLEAGLARATSNFMLATALGIAFIGWRSKLVPVMTVAQDGPAVVMVAVAASLATRNSATPATDALIAVGFVTLVSALLMMAIGRLGLGGIVRYLPTTVVSGFVAGTGWLLAKGGFDVMTGQSLGLSDVSGLVRPGQAKYWVPGLILALAILGSSRSRRIPSLLPSCLPLVAIALFYGVVRAMSTVANVEADSWLIGPFPSGSGVRLLQPTEIVGADWQSAAADLPGLLGVVLIAVVVLLLNLTGLETMRKSRVDLNHETTTASAANFMIAPLGGSVGFHALGASALANELGATSRLVPIGTGIVGAAFAMVGTQMVGYTPLLVIGGLLLTVGLALLIEWVEDLRRTRSRARRLFSIGIVLVIAFIGILEGIVVGLLVAIAIFVYQYSRIDPVRLAGDGHQFRSRVDRTSVAARELDTRRHSLAVYQLQGYLFFGSLNQLANRIRDRYEADESPLSVLVIDFRYVTGIDWSGFSVLGQLSEEVEAVGARLLLAGLSEELTLELERSEPVMMKRVTTANTLDEALEMAELRLLVEAEPKSANIAPEGPQPLSTPLVAEFTREEFSEGSTIVVQGDVTHALHLVLEGEFSVFRTDEAGSRRRLRRFGPQTTIGELAMITKGARSADVVADTDAVVLTMTAAEFDELRDSHPNLALELQDHILFGQATRMVTLSEQLSQALR